MKFNYSLPLGSVAEEEVRRRFGTKLPLRRGLQDQDDEANRGSSHAVADWKELIDPNFYPNWTACESPRGNFITLLIPECLPGRAEILAYLSEYIFARDGKYMKPLTFKFTSILIQSRYCGWRNT